jgi:hypothetical protein
MEKLTTLGAVNRKTKGMALNLTRCVQRLALQADIIEDKAEPCVFLVPFEAKGVKVSVSERILPYMETIQNLVVDLQVEKETIELLDPHCTEGVMRLLMSALRSVAHNPTLWKSDDMDEQTVALAGYLFSQQETATLLQLVAACEYLNVPSVQRVVGFILMRRIERMASSCTRTAYAERFGEQFNEYVWRHVFQHCEHVQLSRCLGCIPEWDEVLVSRAKAEKWTVDQWTALYCLRKQKHVYGLKVRLDLECSPDETDMQLLAPYVTEVELGAYQCHSFMYNPMPGVRKVTIRGATPSNSTLTLIGSMFPSTDTLCGMVTSLLFHPSITHLERLLYIETQRLEKGYIVLPDKIVGLVVKEPVDQSTVICGHGLKHISIPEGIYPVLLV